MSREVCGICWCPYDEETGECACKVPSDCADSHQPVAWRWGYRSITTGEMDWRGYVEIAAHPNLRSPEIVMQPLYTSPPQRKPLTEEDISNIWDGHVVPIFGKNGINPIVFARAVERAHGVV